MFIKFDPFLQADLTIDADGVVRGINHFQAYMPSDQLSARLAAIDYLRKVADVIDVSKVQLVRAHQKASYLDPLERDIEYRLSEEKTFFDSTTTALVQTYLNVPVWHAGITVTVKHNPNRIVSAVNTSHRGIQAKLPDSEIIEKYRKLFDPTTKEEEAVGFVREQFDWTQFKELQKGQYIEDESTRKGDRIVRGRFYIYRYDASARLPDQGEKQPRALVGAKKAEGIRNFEEEYEPTLPLPPVPETIEDGNYYLVAEVILSLWTPQYERLNWRALIELETGTILYLRALVSGVNGMVFVQDPVTSTGNAAMDPNQSNAVLNPHRTSVVLQNLDAPVGGVQHLRGTYADIQHVHLPDGIPAPTEPVGTDFNYDARTDEFAAVNAYYHTDRFFTLVESLGFPIATYFNGTSFPIPVDHRGRGSTINAHCMGDGDGIDHCCYGLADTPPPADLIGIAADWRVHLHELGGHGILHDHVDGPNLGFAHSAGDSMAMIVADPDSNAPDRFELTPWIPIRWCDRDPAAGWAWGGVNDTGIGPFNPGYESEQILSTTLFRIYLSIGGGHPNLSRRQFASRMMAYLILRTVGTLTPATNPGNALDFANSMRAVDLLNWTSEGVFGGAYNKVIRWSFERQGLYQPAGAPSPVTTPGAPPDVDVYIDDGRTGHYDFQHVHWHTTTIWNRRAADGGATHDEPMVGESNYMYVRIKNRGTQAATNVIVRGFHCLPGAGLLWPNDFQAMITPQIVVGGLGAIDTEEQIVGPFEWTPNINSYGHDCVLMIVSATNDPSNIDNFTAGEVIPEWRLVPNDNNIGQRNVHPVPGGGGIQGLLLGLDGISFWAGNPNPRRATIDIEATLPPLLIKRGWRVKFRDLPTSRFTLDAQTRREVFIELHPGADFEPGDVVATADRDVSVQVLADGVTVGGMTYRLDPDIVVPFNRRDQLPSGKKCIGSAKKLLDCLDIPSKDVKCVTVKSVRLDIDFDKGDCDC